MLLCLDSLCKCLLLTLFLCRCCYCCCYYSPMLRHSHSHSLMWVKRTNRNQAVATHWERYYYAENVCAHKRHPIEAHSKRKLKRSKSSYVWVCKKKLLNTIRIKHEKEAASRSKFGQAKVELYAQMFMGDRVAAPNQVCCFHCRANTKCSATWTGHNDIISNCSAVIKLLCIWC